MTALRLGRSVVNDQVIAAEALCWCRLVGGWPDKCRRKTMEAFLALTLVVLVLCAAQRE